MDFMRLLKSVEEFLYELVTWILFYPLTLWRCIRHPLRMMKYAEQELGDAVEKQFDDALSPPIVLLITLFIAHLLELRFGTSSKAALPSFLWDETNLLFYRAVTFSLFPLILGLLDVHQRGARLTRQLLRPSFYSQSYAAAPFVLSIDLSLLIGRQAWPGATALGTALFLAGIFWYCGTQIAWFTQVRSLGLLRATATVLATVLASMLVILAVLVVTALSSPVLQAQLG